MKKGYLVLQDGRVFEGIRFGAEGDTVGELVFTTGMCGYIETLTDPAYAGQIVMQTYPLIGNYGIIREDVERKCQVKGYVVREWCESPSNFRMDGDLDAFLKEEGVPGLWGVDTRELTRIIREHGVMNAIICDQVPQDLSVLETYAITGVVAAATCREPAVFQAEGEERFRVALLDYGASQGLVPALRERGCTVTVLPADTTAEDILAAKPQGVVLSNGAGDPAENVFQVQQIQKLLGKVPMFGVCLGHQLLALAEGGKTYKLKYGHRGANQLLSGIWRACGPTSPPRTMATPWTPIRSGRASSVLSTSMTAPARESITRSCGPSRSSSIRCWAPTVRTR